jgi:tetratricopeptide (TPR) repeat protein
LKPVYTLIIFFFLARPAFASIPAGEIDSLKKQTLFATGQLKANDTTAVNRLNSLAEGYYESQPDSAAYYAKAAINAAIKISYYKGAAAGYVQLGAVNSFNGNYPLAAKNYNTALSLSKKAKSRFGISEAYMGFGRVDDYLGNYAAALNWFEQALAIRKNLRKEIDIADCYAIMGITYDNKGDFSKALDYYFKSLVIDLKLNNQLAAADNYNNIGVVMQHLELWPKALDYFGKANKVWIKLNDKQGISTCYLNIGEVMAAQKKQAQAIDYYRKALPFSTSLATRRGSAWHITILACTSITCRAPIRHCITLTCALHRPVKTISNITRLMLMKGWRKFITPKSNTRKPTNLPYWHSKQPIAWQVP